MEDSKDPAYYTLKFLKFCGLHPDFTSKFWTVYFYVNTACLTGILTLASIGFADTYDKNIFEAIENLQTVFFYVHMLVKYPNLFYKRATLAHLLEQRENFWSLHNYHGKIRKECDEILSRTRKFVLNFLITTHFVILFFFVQPVLTGELPVRVYVPNGWFHYINLTYWYIFPIIMGGIYGADCIFCSICVPIIVQFKLLAYNLETLKYEKVKGIELEKKIQKFVNHQNFLLEYCKEINRYTTPILLNQVIVATAIICMQTFIVSQKEFLLPNKLKCLGYCIMEVIQTAIYCFIAELVSIASKEVGVAAYNSTWYNSDPRNQKSIILVISRAQKQFNFSGFGLVSINLKTFTQIFKTAISFFSYLNTMVNFQGN